MKKPIWILVWRYAATGELGSCAYETRERAMRGKATIASIKSGNATIHRVMRKVEGNSKQV